MPMHRSTGCLNTEEGSTSASLALPSLAPTTASEISQVTLTLDKIQEWRDSDSFGIAQTGGEVRADQ